MKFKMTPMEKKWVLYDVGNSAFTMLVSTIFPIYFNYLAGNAGISDVDYLAYWGYAASVSTLCVALLGPTLGADHRRPQTIQTTKSPHLERRAHFFRAGRLSGGAGYRSRLYER